MKQFLVLAALMILTCQAAAPVANDDFVGIIGLLHCRKPVRPAHNQGDEPFSTGSSVLLFNAQDLASTFATARAVNGAHVHYEPRETKFPSYDGKGIVRVIVSVLTDPDGFVVVLNQRLEDLHRRRAHT